MSNNNNSNRNPGNNDGNNSNSKWVTGAALGLAGAIVGGALYYMNSSKPNQQQQQPATRPAQTTPIATNNQVSTPRMQSSNSTPSTSSRSSSATGGNSDDASSVSSFLSDMLSRMSTSRGGSSSSSYEVRDNVNVPENPVITNLNSLLSDIHVRFIKLKEFDLHYRVFDKIFQDLHKKMKEVDPYYQKYSSTVQFAGSHYDNLRIKKPDEFDMDIVIGLPLNIKMDPLNPESSDIIIEPKHAGFVQLKMGVQFQRLPMRDKEEWLVNRAAYEWKDESNYLLRSKFTAWFKGVVNRALNCFDMTIDGKPLYYVEGVPYIIDKSESGPAMTLLIKNKSRNFQLDVDLVPCLKFPENRWPIGKSYRGIPRECKKDYWMVVGKPNKGSPFVHDQMRSWRIALHNQERELMHNSYNLRQAIRLMKKLRDSQDMEKIASYYIKTIFFWQIIEINDKSFWQKNSPATLFKMMVKKLHQALVAGKIPYFWNERNNLIGGVDRKILDQYAAKLVPLMEVLEQPDKYKLVAKYLLTPQEFKEYNKKILRVSSLL